MLRRSVAVVVVAAGLMWAGGCEKAAKDRIEKSTMTMVDPGAEPRFTLRYAIPAGATQALDMVMDMDMAMEGAGMGGLGDIKMPRMVMRSDVEVTKVHGDGAMDLSMTTTDVRVEDRPGAMAGLAGAMESELAGMNGMRMTMTLTPNGRSKHMKLDEKSVSPAVREQMKQTEQMLDQMTALLPDEPVGVGARWRVEQTIRQQGMRINFAYTYEVQEVSETGALITADVEMSAPEQTIEQNGMKVKLSSLTGGGRFTNRLDFDKLVERVEGRLDLDMAMSAAGQWVTMEMGMGVQMLPAGEAPTPAE